MDDASFFGTCCDDGSVKLWNIQKIEKPGLTKQLRITYNKQGKIISLEKLKESILHV